MWFRQAEGMREKAARMIAAAERLEKEGKFIVKDAIRARKAAR